jgi:hypothetical protein
MEEAEAEKLRESTLSGGGDQKTPQKNGKTIRFADNTKASGMTATLVKKGTVAI